MVGLARFFLDFIDARREARKLLDDHHVKLGRNSLGQLNRRRERLQAAERTVVRHQYFGEHAILPPPRLARRAPRPPLRSASNRVGTRAARAGSAPPPSRSPPPAKSH